MVVDGYLILGPSDVAVLRPSTFNREPQRRSSQNTMSISNLPPLSLSILGVEPLDEFIREVADFIHHMIMNRPNFSGVDAKVEVEAKIGVLKDNMSGRRLILPVLVETS